MSSSSLARRPYSPEPARLALIGLDGATFRILDPMIREGAMPALAELRARGSEAILRSTVPTYTPPAWVSMATGVNPGRHGVFGFLASTPQEPPTIAHSGTVRAVPMWKYLSDIGVEVGIFNVPMSYPPAQVNGWMVSGGLASGWTDPEMANFASDVATGHLVSEIAEGHYPLDVTVSYENDWRSTRTLDRIRRVQRLRRKVLAKLLERSDPQVVFAVYETPDRLQHVYYQYLEECSDWYAKPRASEIRDKATAFFFELDGAISDLADWAGPNGHVVVVSDHGSGPWEKSVNLNLLLEEWGYLSLPRVSKLATLGVVAGAGQRMARRVLPRAWLHRAKANLGRHIIWDETRAFSSHIPEQGVHVNTRGTFVGGIVDPVDASRLEAELTEQLLGLRDPDDGGPITDRVLRRDEVIRGPFAERAPNLFPMFRDQRFELTDTLAASGPITDHRDRPWGYHHRDGVFVAAGPAVCPGRLEAGLDIVDVLPTVLHLAGLPIADDLDGRVVSEIMSGAVATRSVARLSAVGEQEEGEYPFSLEDEAAITESLRGLGYIE